MGVCVSVCREHTHTLTVYRQLFSVHISNRVLMHVMVFLSVCQLVIGEKKKKCVCVCAASGRAAEVTARRSDRGGETLTRAVQPAQSPAALGPV